MSEGHFEHNPHSESPLSAEEMINQMAANTPEEIKDADRDAVMHEFMAELDIVPRKLALEVREKALKVVAEHHELAVEQFADAMRDLEKIQDEIAAELSSLHRSSREVNRDIMETQYGKPEHN